MDDFILEGTEIAPSIYFNAQKGLLRISGRMISISVVEYSYFEPHLKWVREYASKPAEKTNLEFDMEYLSSGGVMVISQVLDIFNNLYKNGHDVAVTWQFAEDDEETEEKGLEFKDIYQFPFQLDSHL